MHQLVSEGTRENRSTDCESNSFLCRFFWEHCLFKPTVLKRKWKNVFKNVIHVHLKKNRHTKEFTAVPSNRTIMGAAYIIKFYKCLKVKRNHLKWSLIMHFTLIQYIKNIIISKCKQCKVYLTKYFTFPPLFFFIWGLQNLVGILHL